MEEWEEAKREGAKRVSVNLENKRQKTVCPKWIKLYREEKLGERKQMPRSGVGEIGREWG